MESDVEIKQIKIIDFYYYSANLEIHDKMGNYLDYLDKT